MAGPFCGGLRLSQLVVHTKVLLELRPVMTRASEHRYEYNKCTEGGEASTSVMDISRDGLPFGRHRQWCHDVLTPRLKKNMRPMLCQARTVTNMALPARTVTNRDMGQI